MGVLKQIKKIVGKDYPFKVTFMKNEILFELWETEIPIIVYKDSLTVKFVPEHCPDLEIPSDMLEDVVVVMRIIEDNIKELVSVL